MDKEARVKSWVSWKCWDQYGGDGYCYLSLVQESCKSAVGALVGPWPTVATLLSLSDVFWDAEALEIASYQFDSGKIHVELLEDRRGANSFLSSVLSVAANGFKWPSGSLGARLCADSSSGLSILLRFTVGGLAFIAPRDNSVEAVRACADYNWTILVADLVSRGLDAATVERFMSMRAGAGVPGGVPPVPGSSVTGPNWERNRANRAVAKARKVEKEKEKIEGSQSSAGKRVERTKVEQELHDLRVERQIIEEKRKLNKLKSPGQIVEDAMRMVNFAQKCAKQQNDSRVAAWAAALSEASAESLAKSGSLPTVESVVSSKVKTVSSKSSVGKATKSDMGCDDGGTRVKRPGVVDPNDIVIAPDGCRVTKSGKSVNSDGLVYTRETALVWIRRYDCIKRNSSLAKSDEDIARDAKVSVTEVKKYFRLKKEFNIVI